MIFNRIPTDRINWVTSSFLIGTFALTLTAVPAYLWFFGISWFQVALVHRACSSPAGMSITLGYHRLFSHMTFKASWPVKLFTSAVRCGGVRKLGSHVVQRTPRPPQARRSRRRSVFHQQGVLFRAHRLAAVQAQLRCAVRQRGGPPERPAHPSGRTGMCSGSASRSASCSRRCSAGR